MCLLLTKNLLNPENDLPSLQNIRKYLKFICEVRK